MFADGSLLQQSNRKPAISGGREVVWACPTASRMSLIKKFSFRESFIALASLLLFFLLPTFANAANIELDYQILSTSNGSTTILIDMTPMEIQADGGIYGEKRNTKYPGYSDYSGSTNACYGGGGGATGYTDTIYQVIASSSHTANTSGGYTDCSASGIYYYNFATYEPNNTIDCSTGKDCYYISYYWDSETQKIIPQTLSNQTQTRHIDLTATSTAGVVTYTSTYFLNISE